jgi:hypothetical protein
VYSGLDSANLLTYALPPEVRFKNHFSVFASGNGSCDFSRVSEIRMLGEEFIPCETIPDLQLWRFGRRKNATDSDQSNCFRSDSGMFPARK